MTAAHDDRAPGLEEYDVVITVVDTYRITGVRAVDPSGAWHAATAAFSAMPDQVRDEHHERTREHVQVYVAPAPTETAPPALSIVR